MYLSPEEIGVYLLLVCHYCQHGYIPDDSKQYTRISRTDTEGTESVLKRFFVKDESGEKWTHNSIDAELQKLQIRRAAARKNGERGGRPPEKKRPPENTRINSGPVQNKPTRDRPQAQSGYNPNLANNKLVVNSNHPPVPKKIITGKFANTAEPRGSDRDLHQQVRDIFLNKQAGGVFTSDQNEEIAIRGLIAKARKITRTRDPTNFVLGMIDRFQKLRDEDVYVRKQPFLPSALNARWTWDKVLSEAQEKYKEQKEYEELNKKDGGISFDWG